MSGLPGLKTVGLLGGGVIGGAWAARFALNGVDVKLYDIDPQATRKMGEIMGNARRAYKKLTLAPLPKEGTITFVSTPEEAVTDVDFVQESAPERLELKQELLARASRAASPTTVFGSSTSGLLPTQIQKDMVNPERFVVGHPFNPVYLMPLVEICGGDLTSQATKERAREVYTQIGMRPLMLSKEIDGFVADRLMEALWREALWMVNDGIATAEEIDDAMRFGPGLRWSFMGTFLVYRIAGGEAGMRHFMAQFGPSLKWPWTKLMDVPELDDVLLEKIVSQSDDQAGTATIRELEALRDDCLVSVFQGLRNQNYGAGQVLADYEKMLFGRGPVPVLDPLAPSVSHEMFIPAEWTDYNGHTNDSRYSQLVSEASDTFFRAIGFTPEYLATGRTFYTVEGHSRFLDQTRAGDKIKVLTRVVSYDEKRIHLWSEVVREDGVVAFTGEHLFMHVDTASGKTSAMGSEMFTLLKPIAEAHAKLPAPAGIGRHVGERPAK
jgi:carnitine 3-dehydrogenase